MERLRNLFRKPINVGIRIQLKILEGSSGFTIQLVPPKVTLQSKYSIDGGSTSLGVLRLQRTPHFVVGGNLAGMTVTSVGD